MWVQSRIRKLASLFSHVSEDSLWLAWFPSVPLFNLVKWRERYSTDWIFLVSITKRRGHATYVGNTPEIRLFLRSANVTKPDTLTLTGGLWCCFSMLQIGIALNNWNSFCVAQRFVYHLVYFESVIGKAAVFREVLLTSQWREELNLQEKNMFFSTTKH